MTAFTIQSETSEADDRLWVQTQTQKETATVWCLHAPAGTEPQKVADRLVATGLTNRRYCGGDSWRQWAEGIGEEDDEAAIHVYFDAPSLGQAKVKGESITDLAGLDPSDVALSTAGDWAEQVDLADLDPGKETPEYDEATIAEAEADPDYTTITVVVTTEAAAGFADVVHHHDSVQFVGIVAGISRSAFEAGADPEQWS